MKRRILLRCSRADREQAELLRAKWKDVIHATLDEEVDQPRLMVASEPDAEAGDSNPEAKPRVGVLLIGAETASDTSLMARITNGLKNGDCVIGVLLDPEFEVPSALYAAGSEILTCDSNELPQACDRATTGIRRAPAIVDAANSATSGEPDCARAPTGVVQGDLVPIPE